MSAVDLFSILFAVPIFAQCSVTLTLLLFSIFKKRKEEVIGELPNVSILVPFFNETPSLLIKALECLEVQEYPADIQVVLIDDGSTNNAPEEVTQWLTIERVNNYQLLTRSKNEGRKGLALDFALESGVLDGEVYIVVDSDTFIESDGIKELVKKLWSDPDYAAVCGYIIPENSSGNFIKRMQYYEHLSFFGAVRTAQDQLGVLPVLSGAFVAHRASAVHEVGGWGRWLVEDISWCWDALAKQYKTGYAIKAGATTHVPENYKEFFNQRRRWSRGRVEAYATVWSISPIKGMLFTPWFLFIAMQCTLPPRLILLPILACFSIWLPIIASLISLGLDVLLFMAHITQNGNHRKVKKREVFRSTFFLSIIEVVIWLPDVLGYCDEVTRKRKSWLTR